MTDQKEQPFSYFDTKTLMNKDNQKELNILIQAMFDCPSTYQFRSPVQWEKYVSLNYLQIVKKPMDLLTVRLNLKKGVYKTIQEYLDDIQLIWENSKLFNDENSWIYQLTLKCEEIYHKTIKNYFSKLIFKEKNKNSKNKNSEKNEKNQVLQTESEKNQEKETIMQMQEKYSDKNSDLDYSSKQKKIDVLRKNFLRRAMKSTYQQVSVIYLMVKNNCSKAIKHDIQGNCCIDAGQLEEQLLSKIFDFLNSPKPQIKPKKKTRKSQTSSISVKKLKTRQL